MERKIRETKRILAAQDECILTTEDKSLKEEATNKFVDASVKLKRQETELKNFCNKTGLTQSSDRTQKYGFNKSVSKTTNATAEKYYENWAKSHNINNIETLAKYYDVKYNDVERYRLLRGYVNAVNIGDISPLVGFDLYESTANEATEKLCGLVIDGKYKINGFVPHFIDRVIGQTSTSHTGMRLGAPIEQINDSIISIKKISEPFFVNIKKNGKEYLDKRIKITGRSCSFIYSITDNLLVQATSFGEGIIL